MANSEENINKDKNENRNINIEQNSPEILTILKPVLTSMISPAHFMITLYKNGFSEFQRLGFSI